MSFRKINNITADIKTRLTASGLFKEVTANAVTSYEHLLELIPELIRFPAAVVTVGSGDYSSNAGIRELNPGIVIIDRFAATKTKAAVGIWTLLDATQDLFIPSIPDGRDQPCPVVINGVGYQLQSFRPIELGSGFAAYMLEIKTTGE